MQPQGRLLHAEGDGAGTLGLLLKCAATGNWHHVAGVPERTIAIAKARDSNKKAWGRVHPLLLQHPESRDVSTRGT